MGGGLSDKTGIGRSHGDVDRLRLGVIVGFDLNLVDFVVMILQLFHSFVAGLLDIDARDTGDGDGNQGD
ncbi:MAG: hypothetical protein RIE73_15450 [Coleofasciculus sp. C1-SOL-03]|uniref:hypothetical protein n=1 Tax=Coleofasciculus sp. C1-SOL-03 TaxID=3069522 RepID=UPI0032FF5761